MQNEEQSLTGSQSSAVKEFGPYLVFERLGWGGMAMVHRAKKRGIAGFERGVALKRILPHLSKDAEFVNSFVHEAKLASLLVHPNIAQIYDFGQIDNVYFIAMEHVDGVGVRELLRYCHHHHCLLPVNVVLSILCELCEALAYAHTYVDENGQPMGIVHRDVSPSNLILAQTGHLKVIDFGIAKARSRPLDTESGQVKGKLSYMSPEALKGPQVGPPSDVFSVGIVAHELLTADRLFYAPTDREIVRRVHEIEIMPPSRKNPHVPALLDRVVLAALERDERLRLQSAGEFRKILDKVAIEAGIRFSPSDVAEWWARGGVINDHKGSRESPPSGSRSAPKLRLPRLGEPSGIQHQEHSDRTSRRLSAASAEQLHGDPLAESGAQSFGSLDPMPGELPLPVSVPRSASSPPRSRSRRHAVLVLVGLCAIAAGLGTYQFVMRPTPAVAPALSARPAAPPGLASVKFVVQPLDAVVELGGKEVSRQSPFELRLERGVYTVAVSHAGYKRWTSQITLHDPESQTVNVALEPATSIIRVSSQPAGLVAELDGKPLDQVTPGEFETSPGPHRLVVVGATGTWAQNFVAKADGTHAFHAVLPPAKRSPTAATISGVARTTPAASERTTQRASSGNAARTSVAREPVIEFDDRAIELGPEQSAVKPLAKAEPPVKPAAQPGPTVTSVTSLPASLSVPRSSAPPLVPATTVTKLSGAIPAIQSGSGSTDVHSKICIDIDGRVTSVKIIRTSAGVAAELQRTLLGWRYKPYVDESGQPSPACFAVSFRLVFERAHGG